MLILGGNFGNGLAVLEAGVFDSGGEDFAAKNTPGSSGSGSVVSDQSKGFFKKEMRAGRKVPICWGATGLAAKGLWRK
jgi:hypothetical protein